MDRAAAIIVRSRQVALIQREKGIRPERYFVFPGGGVESNESVEQAVEREVREELGLEVKAGRRIVTVSFRGQRQFYHLAEIVGGVFGTGDGPEMSGDYDGSRGTYLPVWMAIDRLLDEPVYPRIVSEVIVKSEQWGWPPHAVDTIDAG